MNKLLNTASERQIYKKISVHFPQSINLTFDKLNPSQNRWENITVE